MRRKYTADCIKVMQAYVEGKQIQYKDDEVWIDIECPDWDWHNWEYRIKPELKCRPFRNAEECLEEMKKHQPFGWVKDKYSFYPIEMIGTNFSKGWIKCYGIWMTPEQVFNKVTFLDGTPFGILVENSLHIIQ